MKPRSQNKVFSIMTDKIISLLEEGTVPWCQKWDRPLPRNFTTGLEFEGFNLIYLYNMGIVKNYKSPFWLTYRQGISLQARLKPMQYEKPEIAFVYTPSPFRLSFYDLYNVEQFERIEYQNPEPIKRLKMSFVDIGKTISYKDSFIADLQLALTCAALRFSYKIPDHAQWTNIEKWLDALRNDNKLFVQSCYEAQELVKETLPHLLGNIAPLTKTL